MSRFTIAEARILTLKGESGPRRGDSASDLGVIERGYITIEGERITSLGSGEPPESSEGGDVLTVAGNVVLPTFVDCHTHVCWAGQRLDEFEMKQKGLAYLDILNAGGGIMSTVRAVREIDEVELCESLMRRLTGMAALGTGAVEIKSGYGLNTAIELKMLRAIHAVSGQTAQTIAGTFLGAHAIDPDNPGAYHALAILSQMTGEGPVVFRNFAEKAIELNPNDASSLADLGTWIAYSGAWEKGKEWVTRAN